MRKGMWFSHSFSFFYKGFETTEIKFHKYLIQNPVTFKFNYLKNTKSPINIT